MLSASVAFNWSSCFSPCPPPYSVLNTAAGMILFSHKSDSVSSVPQTPQGLRLTQGKSQSPPRGPQGTPSISSLVSSPALLTPPHTHAGLPAGPQICPGCLPSRPHHCGALSLTSHLLKVCSVPPTNLFKVAACPQPHLRPSVPF